jgi:hypothetical protein
MGNRLGNDGGEHARSLARHRENEFLVHKSTYEDIIGTGHAGQGWCLLLPCDMRNSTSSESLRDSSNITAVIRLVLSDIDEGRLGFPAG